MNNRVPASVFAPSFRRFRRNRPATAGCVMLSVFALVGLVTLPFSYGWYDHQVLEYVRRAPTGSNPAPYNDSARRRLQHVFPEVIVDYTGPFMYNLGGIFGFDSLGRSLFYRCLLGGLISLGIGLMAAAISVSVGVVWGAGAGLAGGKIDQVLMRIVDILYGLPYILLVILLKVALEAPLARLFQSTRFSGVVILFVAIGANSWLTMARVIRGQVLSLKHQPFIEAARVCGAGWFRILYRHLLPNLTGPIIVYGSLVVPQAILSESFLSFLGIGVQRPVPTWGFLVAEGLQATDSLLHHWWLLVFPCACLSLALVALNFVGEGLRDALDPRPA